MQSARKFLPEERRERPVIGRSTRPLSVRMGHMVPWLIAALLIIGLLGMNIMFVLAARAIRRDMTKRFDELQRRLESRANSIVDNIFDANRS